MYYNLPFLLFSNIINYIAVIKFLPNRILEMTTVNAGAELFTVSVKLTATKLSAMRPRRTVVNLRPPIINICL